jgi:hypothetical protein
VEGKEICWFGRNGGCHRTVELTTVVEVNQDITVYEGLNPFRGSICSYPLDKATLTIAESALKSGPGSVDNRQLQQQSRI